MGSSIEPNACTSSRSARTEISSAGIYSMLSSPGGWLFAEPAFPLVGSYLPADIGFWLFQATVCSDLEAARNLAIWTSIAAKTV